MRALAPLADLTRALAERVFGPAPARPNGGRPLPPSATLGHPRTCWCGQESGHDWPGKADGDPHPREGS